MVKIPRWARPHTVTYKKRTGTDIHQKSTYADPVTIQYVRMEPTSKIVLSKDNTQVQLASVLFYDCQDSLPTGITFSALDVITFNGHDYTVIEPDPLYALSSTPHHYEVGLI